MAVGVVDGRFYKRFCGTMHGHVNVGKLVATFALTSLGTASPLCINQQT